MAKVFLVSTNRKVSRNYIESKIVGFVTVFGWEKPVVKAAAKYPGLGNIQVHESTRLFK